MHVDAHLFDGVSFVRTWMRFMICLMVILHMDASSSRVLGTWMPLFTAMILCDVCMNRHMDALMDANVLFFGFGIFR